MPVTEKQKSGLFLYQRTQYQKGGISRLYWDYKDKKVINEINDRDYSILELGCGEGIMLEKLINLYPQKNVGIDIMPENIQIGIKYGLPIQLGDIYNLDVPENSIDVVVLMEVIEHLTAPDRAINGIYKVLKPQGKLLIVFPNDISFLVARVLTLNFKEAFYDSGHLKQWTHGEIKKFLNYNGFYVIKSTSIPLLLWPFSLHGLTVAIKGN